MHGEMQVKQSSVKGDRPVCPRDEAHRVHRHGSYPHFEDCEIESKVVRVPRFLCVGCQLTISVVPDTRLPYRSLGLDVLWRWFDCQFRGGQGPPEMTEKERDCAKRAWKGFESHSPTLRTALGQIVKDVGANAGSLWRALHRLSKSWPILHFLQTRIKPLEHAGSRRGFSLLGTYLCLGLPPLFTG